MRAKTTTTLWLIVFCLGMVVVYRLQFDQEKTLIHEEPPAQSTTYKRHNQESSESPNMTEDETINNIPVPPKTALSEDRTQNEIQAEDFKTKWKEIASLPISEQFQARNVILSEWILHSPANALEAFNKSSDRSKPGMIASIASNWGKQDPQSATRWALQLPPVHSPRALAHVVRGWAQKDRTSAYRYAESIPSGIHKSGVYTLLAQDSSAPPSEVANWLTRQEDKPEVNKALLELTTRWSRSSHKNAEAWTLQLPAGNARDSSLQGLSRGILARDPGKSFYYTQQIQSPSIQRLQIRSLVNDYAQTCLPCHRKQEPLNCLRQQVQSLPGSIVPQDMKSRVFQIVQENLKK